MFVLTKSASFYWPVTISIPQDGGTFAKQSFDAQFKRIKQSRIKEVNDPNSASITDNDFCKEIMIGWRGVKGEDGQDIPFSEGALEEMIEMPLVAATIATAYFQALRGAKAKN